MKPKNTVLAVTLLFIGIVGFNTNAYAVPSFARQTGFQCAMCHTSYPELTQFGRAFKLNGYTITGVKQIESPRTPESAGLKINEIPPLSAMLQLSATAMNKKDPANQNDSVGFPQEASLFFAGEIAEHLGTFLQMTYAQDAAKLEWDNTDVRYANHTGNTTWGLTLNNNPSVQDLWNTTPAWGFPFASSGAANAPETTTLIDGTLAQDVGGLGGYALFNNQFYGEVTMYRSTHQGETAPSSSSSNTVNGLAPYWRLAWQRNFGPSYLMVGAYGLSADLFPSGITGQTDKYNDAALDTQYERPFGANSLTIRGTYIHEKRNLDATFASGGSTNSSGTLKTFRLNGTYHIRGTYAFSLGGFQTTGSDDALLYGAPTYANGSPDSSGEILQWTYLPWQNVQVVAQYTAYSKFNGASTNYDGAGRNASDNNTMYLLLWLIW